MVPACLPWAASPSASLPPVAHLVYGKGLGHGGESQAWAQVTREAWAGVVSLCSLVGMAGGEQVAEGSGAREQPHSWSSLCASQLPGKCFPPPPM